MVLHHLLETVSQLSLVVVRKSSCFLFLLCAAVLVFFFAAKRMVLSSNMKLAVMRDFVHSALK